MRQKGISFRSSFITIGTMENGHPTIAVDQRISRFRYQNLFGLSWTSQVTPSWLQKVNGGYSMYLQEMGTQQSDDTQYYPQNPLTVNGTEMARCFLLKEVMNLPFLIKWLMSLSVGNAIKVKIE